MKSFLVCQQALPLLWGKTLLCYWPIFPLMAPTYFITSINLDYGIQWIKTKKNTLLFSFNVENVQSCNCNRMKWVQYYDGICPNVETKSEFFIFRHSGRQQSRFADTVCGPTARQAHCGDLPYTVRGDFGKDQARSGRCFLHFGPRDSKIRELHASSCV